MTCHIVLMRHTESNVASIGHFDNFSCWQFGDESSAHKEGLKVMMEEIEFLSKDDLAEGRVPKVQNFPDSKLLFTITIQMKCVLIVCHLRQ